MPNSAPRNSSFDPASPSGSQDNGLGWDLADTAYLVINIYQALGASLQLAGKGGDTVGGQMLQKDLKALS